MKRITSAVLIMSLLICAAISSHAQEKKIKTGLTREDWAYKLAEGVTAKEVTYYSDGVACYAKLFFPKGFSATGKTPGVVLGQGWAGTHFSIEKYGARFAERGLVAMVIDYRSWGYSDGFTTLAQKGLNNPNDLVYSIDGSIYFSDLPPRGAAGKPMVYQITRKGDLRVATAPMA